MKANVLEERDQFQGLYEAGKAQANENAPTWLTELREKAFARYCQLGLPTPRQEAWRFTNTKTLQRTPFENHQPGTPPDNSDSYHLSDSICRLVFLNGNYREDLSELSELPSGLTVLPMHLAISQRADLLQEHLGHGLAEETEPFQALNGAMLGQGLLVHAAKDAVLEQPVEVVYLTDPGSVAGAVHPRNLLIAEANSRMTVVETYRGFGNNQYFTNSLTQVFIEQNAEVHHYFRENENERAWHMRGLDVHQQQDSKFQSHNLMIGGSLVRNNVRVVFNESGADAVINGFYIGHEDQVLDNHILIDHAQPNCTSTQFVKGILDHKSRGIFCGRIVVREDAQKTDSSQTNRNLLLSEDARVDTMPQLEIYADDVKCAHGATTGQLDEDAMFYLQTRGVDPESARDLLVFAFAHEVIDRMPLESVRQSAEAFLFERFHTARLLGEVQ